MTDRIWYYKGAFGEEGPFSAEQMKELSRNGDIGADTLIRKEGMDKHVPAERVKGLLQAAAPAPEPVSQAEAPQPVDEPSSRPSPRGTATTRRGTARQRRRPGGRSDNAFSAPGSDDMADDDGDQGGVVKILRPLAKRTGWMTFTGIMLIVLAGLYTLATLFIGIVVTWYPIMLGIILIQSASNLKNMATRNDARAGASAVRKLSGFFLALGIGLLVYVILIVVLIFFAFAMGMAGGLR